MKYTGAFASFSAGDIAKAKEFYGTLLGLEVKERPEGLQLELPGVSVFIYPKPGHTPATFTVLNLLVDDIEASVGELMAKGVAFEHYDEGMLKTDDQGIARSPDGMPGPRAIAWFKDPAGNFLALIQEK